MRRRALWLFGSGQICLLAGLIICIILKPLGLTINDGLSYYGTIWETFLPYAFCLLGPALLGLMTARQIIDDKLRTLNLVLTASAMLGAVIVIAPYSIGIFVHIIHDTAAFILFIMQLAASFWLVKRLDYRPWTLLIVLLEFVSGIMATVYVLSKHGYLLQSQVVFQLLFGGLVIYGLSRLLPEQSRDIQQD